MAARSPRIQGLLDLWAAHREISSLEWLEFQQTMYAAARWLLCAAIGILVSWLALNAALFIALRDQPLRAAMAGWQANRLLRRPFFALTKREASRDDDGATDRHFGASNLNHERPR